MRGNETTNETIGHKGQTWRGETPREEAAMAHSLDEARKIAEPMFSDPAVDSVDVNSWIGLLRIFRDGDIRFVADLPLDGNGWKV